MTAIQRDMMKALTTILIILNFWGCNVGYDLSNKPSETLEWLAIGKKDDPAGIRTTGYDPADIIPSEQHNWIFGNETEWQEYLKGFVNNYYVDPAAGSDSNPGDVTQPFASFPYAISKIEPNGVAIIQILGDVEVDEDIDLHDKGVIVFPDSTEKITFKTNVIGADSDEIYHLNLYGSSKFICTAGIKLETGSFTTLQSAIKVYAKNEVQILGGVTITANAATNKPSIVDAGLSSLGQGVVNLVTGGTLTTNSDGYIVGAVGDTIGGTLYDVNEGTLIDDPDYWIDDSDTKTIFSCDMDVTISYNVVLHGTRFDGSYNEEFFSTGITLATAAANIATHLASAYNGIATDITVVSTSPLVFTAKGLPYNTPSFKIKRIAASGGAFDSASMMKVDKIRKIRRNF